MQTETRPQPFEQKPDYDFRQEVYGLISLYMDALSPRQVSDTLREIADEEAKRVT